MIFGEYRSMFLDTAGLRETAMTRSRGPGWTARGHGQKTRCRFARASGCARRPAGRQVARSLFRKDDINLRSKADLSRDPGDLAIVRAGWPRASTGSWMPCMQGCRRLRRGRDCWRTCVTRRVCGTAAGSSTAFSRDWRRQTRRSWPRNCAMRSSRWKSWLVESTARRYWTLSSALSALGSRTCFT